MWGRMELNGKPSEVEEDRKMQREGKETEAERMMASVPYWVMGTNL